MPGDQKNMFDAKIEQILAKIADLQAKLESERKTLEKLDPENHEERNYRRECEWCIRDYIADIGTLQKELESLREFSDQYQNQR